MRVLNSTIIVMLLTATQALASGGGEAEPLSFLTILFIGFGAVILVFQIFPALILFCGMVKGIVSAKSTNEAEAAGKK